jgi:hypothetical protein
LPDGLKDAQPRGAAHEKQQLLSPEDEKSIVRFCETLDDLGHLLHGKMEKALVMSILPSHRQLQLGNHWMTCIFNHAPAITTKFSQSLDIQMANANDSAILKDFFARYIILIHTLIFS